MTEYEKAVKITTALVGRDLDTAKSDLARAVARVQRYAAEMAQAVEHGWELSCHASNVSNAATEAAILAERVKALTFAVRSISEITDMAEDA